LTSLSLCDTLNNTPAKFERSFFISSSKEEIEKHEVAVGSSKVATKHTSRLLPVDGADDISLRISFQSFCFPSFFFKFYLLPWL